jgi:Fe2+ transport system protein FeoA
MIRFNQITFAWKRNRRMNFDNSDNTSSCPRRSSQLTLADIAPGRKARLVGFCPGLAADRRAQLMAYGMTPGHMIQVLQHQPVTIIRVEHTELAMEIEVACEILVESFMQDILN